MPLDETLLSDIMNVSVRNNVRDEITGVLMYHDNLFFQLLEGEQSVVKRCFARIQRDQRHKRVTLVWDHIAGARVFSSWAMGYAGPEQFGEYKDASQEYLANMLDQEQTTKGSSSVALKIARSFFKNFKKSNSLTHFPEHNRKSSFDE